jgi:DNA repair protein RadC
MHSAPAISFKFDERYRFAENALILDNEGRRYVLRFKDLDDADKPRERLLAHGAATLSAAELLAVVLNVGTRREDVLAMANRILKEYGEKSITNQINPQTLQTELGVPLVKACQIVACFELGRRFFKQNPGRQVTIRTARQVFNYLSDMRSMQKEQLRGLYLNSRYRLIHDEVISVGTLTANIVHPREVFGPALEYAAAAVIIAHNHPSGSNKPTQADIVVTEQLISAGKIMGVDLLDHIIIAGNTFASVPAVYSGV